MTKLFLLLRKTVHEDVTSSLKEEIKTWRNLYEELHNKTKPFQVCKEVNSPWNLVHVVESSSALGINTLFLHLKPFILQSFPKLLFLETAVSLPKPVCTCRSQCGRKGAVGG